MLLLGLWQVDDTRLVIVIFVRLSLLESLSIQSYVVNYTLGIILIQFHRLSMRVDNLDISTPLVGDKAEQDALENGDKTRFYFQKLINLEQSLSTVAVINLALMVTYSCTVFDSSDSADQFFVDSILYLLLASAGVEIMISFLRIQCKLQLMKEQKNIHFNADLFSSKMVYYMIAEAAMFLLQPTPFTKNASENQDSEYYFYLNEMLCITCLFRVYVLARNLLTKTPYMSPRSNRLCKLHGCEASYEYALKCLFHDKPLFLILIGIGSSIFILGFAIQVCERPLARSQYLPTNLGIYANAIWLTVETMTTVGFGDFYPLTIFGRIVLLVIMVWGIFIVPIMVVVVTNTLQMEKAETRTLIVLKRLNVSRQLKECAGEFIGAVMRTKKQMTEAIAESARKQILRLKQKFKSKNLQLKELQYNDDTYEQMLLKFEELNEDIKVLNRNQEELINYIHNNFECEEQDQEEKKKEKEKEKEKEDWFPKQPEPL